MLPPITAEITATHTGNTGVTSVVISNITGVGVIITTIPGIGIMGVITVG